MTDYAVVSPIGERASSRRSTLRAVLPVLAVVAAFYAVAVGVRLEQHGIHWFVHFSDDFIASSTADGTPGLEAAVDRHYDGAYYWAVAVDPTGAHEYLPPEISGYVYSRALYPAVARTAALGSATLVPWTMLLVNLLAVAAGTLAVAVWLRARGMTPWYALVYGLYPGLVFAVFHDLTEPLAYGLTALAVVTFGRTRSRLWAAAALFALAALTRETTALFALVGAAALVWPAGGSSEALTRRLSRSGLFLAAAIGPLFVWRAVLVQVLDSPTQERWSGLEAAIPLHGIFEWWPWVAEHRLVVGAVVVPTLVALAAVPWLLRSRDGRLAAALVVLNAAALVIFLPWPVFIDYRGAGRAATGVMLAVLVCLPAWKRSRRPFLVPLVALPWSIAWFMVVASIVGRPGYSLITS